MTAKSLLVIGGSGFFGKSILDAHGRGLLSPWEIERIIVAARQADTLRHEYPDLITDSVEMISTDIGTAADLPYADYVIHAASSTDARRYVSAPADERANILQAIDNYCRLAARVHRSSKIVYASSGAVYGQVPPHIDQVAEDFDPGDVSELIAYKRDYAEAKRTAEQRMASLGEEHGISVSVARCFAFVGAYLPRDQHFAIGNFLADGLAGRPVTVNARKPVYRSYMHADDLVRWLMTLADGADTTCGIYNVGSNEAFTVGDVARKVAERFGVRADVPEFETADVDRYIPSITRAQDRLGLTLTLDLDAALDDVISRLREDRLAPARPRKRN